jgi:type II secretory pathway pseudopilin PulG
MSKRKTLLHKSRAIRTFLNSLSTRRTRGSFLNEGGAIDVTSIMIAVLVLGILAGLIASTVFVIIPWAQDHSAKNQLKSVMSAQQAYAGMAATEQASTPVGSIYALRLNSARSVKASNSNTGEYGDLTDLIEADLFDPAFLPNDAADEEYGEQMLSPDKSICITKLEAGKGYEAAVRSKSGNVFITNDGWQGPIKVSDTVPVCLGRILGDFSDYEKAISNPQPEPTVTPTTTLTPYTPAPEPTETPVATPTPTPTPTQAPTTPPAEVTPTPAPSTAAPEAPKPEPVPDAPAENKDPKTKKFMFCHKGSMHSNAFNGMVNGHQGHDEDIMPPIPPKNYAGWNWNATTAKVYYNNCVPL